MSFTVQGYSGVLEIPQSINYTPKGGWKTSRKWKGPRDGIQSMAVSYVREFGNTINVSIEPLEPDLATLTITFDRLEGDPPPEAQEDGTKEEETASWTLTGQNMELSLWTHPQVKDLAENCPVSYSYLRKNLKIVQDKGTWTEVLAAWQENDDCDTKGKTVMKLFRDGITSYQHSAYVIRRSAIIRNDAQGTIATGNVNSIFTKAQLQSLEGMPSTLSFAVPDIKWLKGAPTISLQNNKLTAENEWVGADDWSTYIYYNAA